MRARRLLARLVPLLLVAAALGVFAPPVSQASCVGPLVGIGPTPPAVPGEPARDTVLRRGEPLVVSGAWFSDGCDDTVGITVGCLGQPTEQHTPVNPQQDVELVLTQGSRHWTMDTQDASPEQPYAITWHGIVPADARPGGATLNAGSAQLPVIIE